MKYIKGLILALVLVFVSCQADAQDRTRNGRMRVSYGYYDGVSADTISTNQDTIDVVFLLQPDQSVLWNVNVRLDTLVGYPATDSVKIEVFGKVFLNDSISSISTAQYFDTIANLPIALSENSTADFVRYIMVRLVQFGSTGKATLNISDNNNKAIEVKGWF